MSEANQPTEGRRVTENDKTVEVDKDDEDICNDCRREQETDIPDIGSFFHMLGDTFSHGFSEGYSRGFGEGIAMAKAMFVASMEEKKQIGAMFDINPQHDHGETDTKTPPNRAKSGDAGYQ